MLGSRFPVPSGRGVWPVVGVFGKRIPHVVPQLAEGLVKTFQRIVLATTGEQDSERQQPDGDEVFHQVTAISSSSLLFKRIPAWKFSTAKFSFGEWTLQSGNANPNSNVSIPRISLNDWVMGTLPPSRMKATGLPKVSTSAF